MDLAWGRDCTNSQHLIIFSPNIFCDQYCCLYGVIAVLNKSDNVDKMNLLQNKNYANDNIIEEIYLVYKAIFEKSQSLKKLIT